MQIDIPKKTPSLLIGISCRDVLISTRRCLNNEGHLITATISFMMFSSRWNCSGERSRVIWEKYCNAAVFISTVVLLSMKRSSTRMSRPLQIRSSVFKVGFWTPRSICPTYAAFMSQRKAKSSRLNPSSLRIFLIRSPTRDASSAGSDSGWSFAFIRRLFIIRYFCKNYFFPQKNSTEWKLQS